MDDSGSATLIKPKVHLMDSLAEKLATAVEKLTASHDMSDPVIREEVLARARVQLASAILKLRESRGDAAADSAMSALDSVLAQKAEQYAKGKGALPDPAAITAINRSPERGKTNRAGNPTTTRSVKKPAPLVPFLAGLFCGLLVTAGIFAGQASGLIDLSAADFINPSDTSMSTDATIVSSMNNEAVSADVLINDDVETSGALVDEIISVLRRVRSELENDGLDRHPELEKASGFVRIEKIYPDVWKDASQDARRSAIIVIRTRGDGYKVAARSELCPAVAVRFPEYVDPVRSKYKVLCGWFGLWNEEGKSL